MGPLFERGKIRMQRRQMKYTAGGIEFTFQHPGLRLAARIKDTSRDQYGHLADEPLFTQLMEHVIVFPKTTWEWWDAEPEREDIMKEVFAEALRFLIVRPKDESARMGEESGEKLDVLETRS
jgi:hypothetical protein